MSGTIVTPEVSKSFGQTYHEEVEELKASGVGNAEAVRQVAEKHGKPVGSVRGGIYQYKVRNGVDGGGNGRSRRATASVDDCVIQARASLEKALAMIDTEVAAARDSADGARAHYEQLQASVKERKADIEKKLKALA